MKKTSPQEITEDHRAMAALGEGDHSAFKKIVKRHQGALINYFLRYTGNIDTAQELSQEVFLRVFKAAKRYKPRAKFTTYLFSIAHNLAINEVIAKKRPFIVSYDGDETKNFTSDSEDNPERKMLKSETMENIEFAMKKLNPRERSAVVMKYTQGMSYAEIAEITKSSVPAIESLLMRAKGKLKKWLKKEKIALDGF